LDTNTPGQPPSNARGAISQLNRKKRLAYGLSAILAIAAALALSAWLKLDPAGHFTQVQVSFDKDSVPIRDIGSLLGSFLAGPVIPFVLGLLSIAVLAILVINDHFTLALGSVVAFSLTLFVMMSFTIGTSRLELNTPAAFMKQLAEENRLEELGEASLVLMPPEQSTYIKAQINYLRGNSAGVRTNLLALQDAKFASWQPNWVQYHVMELYSGIDVLQPKAKEYGETAYSNYRFAGYALLGLTIAALAAGLSGLLFNRRLKRMAHDLSMLDTPSAPDTLPPTAYASSGPDLRSGWTPAWQRNPPRRAQAADNTTEIDSGSDAALALLGGLAVGSLLNSDSGSCHSSVDSTFDCGSVDISIGGGD